ncbi:hypothetical protein DFQ26_006071 [Actinomortierella ambigua]|nr:hypothetical protein DFQ26_006071 [Actinomortierella ambigua]
MLVESPTSMLPPGEQLPFLDLLGPPASESTSMDDSSDEDDPDYEFERQLPAPDWLYFGGPATDVSPGDIPRMLCNVQTRRKPGPNPYGELEHRLVFCLLGASDSFYTVNASTWSCSRVGPFEGGLALQYPVAQAVALKVCADQVDFRGRTRVLVAVVYGMKFDPHAEVDMMDTAWPDDGGVGIDDDDGDDDDLNDNAKFILDIWETFDVVEVWIPIPSTSPSSPDTPRTGCRSSSCSEETACNSLPFGGINSSNSNSNSNSDGSGSGSSSNIDNAFTCPFLNSTWPPQSPRRLLPAHEGDKISLRLEDGRRFRGRSARFITIDGEEYLFILGLLHESNGNTSVQIYHLSRGLICSHQMGLFTESVAFFPSHSGYDHLIVLLNWGGNCQVWDIFEGRPVLSLYRDMPRSQSFSSRDVPSRFPRKAVSRTQHLPCYGGAQWKQVSKDQYKRHGLRTWGIQVSRAVEGETPIPPMTTEKTMMAGGPFRVVTFSDAWEANHNAFQTQDELSSGRGMWETRWWHLDGNDLGPPRALTYVDLMRPADLPPAPPGWAFRIPLSNWTGVERCWMQWPPEPPFPLSPPPSFQPWSLDVILNQGISPSFVMDAPDPRVLPQVFAHCRHCEWLTGQPRLRRRGPTESRRSALAASGLDPNSRDGSRQKKSPLPEPTAICFATDDNVVLSVPHHLTEHPSFDWVKKIRVKIMVVWHHYRIVATSQRGIYMVDMEAEQSQYGGQITVVQPHEVGDLVSISLAGHSLVITRLSGIDTVPLAGPFLKS